MSAWLLAAMLALAPPGRVPARESEADGRARYATIAEDIEATIRDANGSDSEAALLVAIAYHESGFRLDVDRGEKRGGGVDLCLLQIRPRGKADEAELLDRRTCLRRGLMLARRSLRLCASNSLDDRLTAYASGSCGRGVKESRAFAALTRRVLAHRPAKKKAAPASAQPTAPANEPSPAPVLEAAK